MIAIISDIHGNYPALKAVLQEIDSMRIEKIISLGAVAGYYCMVNECIDELRRRNIINILGNHDSYLIGKGQCPRSMTVNKCIDYQKKIITKKNLKYLAKSVEKLDTNLFSARHGGWNDPLDEYISDFDFSIAENYFVHLFISGHIHVQKKQTDGINTYFNPGGVGQPRDNDPRAAFAIIDDNNEVHLHRVSYNIDEIANAMSKEGFESRLTDCLYKGTKIRTFGT